MEDNRANLLSKTKQIKSLCEVMLELDSYKSELILLISDLTEDMIELQK